MPRVLNTLNPHDDISVLLASTLDMVNVIHKSSQVVPQVAANAKSYVDTCLLATGREGDRPVLATTWMYFHTKMVLAYLRMSAMSYNAVSDSVLSVAVQCS